MLCNLCYEPRPGERMTVIGVRLFCRQCVIRVLQDTSLSSGMYAKPQEPATWTCWLCERRIDEGLPKYDDGIYHTDKAWCATCAKHCAVLKARDLKAGMFKSGWPKTDPQPAPESMVDAVDVKPTAHCAWCRNPDAPAIHGLCKGCYEQMDAAYPAWSKRPAKADDVAAKDARIRELEAENKRLRDEVDAARDEALDCRMAIGAIKAALANLHLEARNADL
jgi:hypothetical protein